MSNNGVKLYNIVEAIPPEPDDPKAAYFTPHKVVVRAHEFGEQKHDSLVKQIENFKVQNTMVSVHSIGEAFD